MSVFYVECADRVFACHLEPDTPGTCRRRLSVSVESGPPLSDEECRSLSARIVAELVGVGHDVRGWEISVEEG